jgi:hypothetical protein
LFTVQINFPFQSVTRRRFSCTDPDHSQFVRAENSLTLTECLKVKLYAFRHRFMLYILLLSPFTIDGPSSKRTGKAYFCSPLVTVTQLPHSNKKYSASTHTTIVSIHISHL